MNAMSLCAIEIELTAINTALRPLIKRQAELVKEKRRLESVAFIQAFNVTRDNVEMSHGDTNPWFGEIFVFGKWMKKTGCQKRFCEWNGIIYFTAEIVAGRMDPAAPGRVNDIGAARNEAPDAATPEAPTPPPITDQLTSTG